MNPRTNYEMTQADLEEIIEACKPTPVMFLSGGQPMGGTPQENANRAWAVLGAKMGFDAMTVRPADGKGNRFFTAVPTENEAQKDERLKREANQKRQSEIDNLKIDIELKRQRLAELEEQS